MKKYAVWDEVFDIMTSGAFERLTEQQLIQFYFQSSERDAQIIKVFDTEEESIRCFERLELCRAKELDFHQGLVHIAYVQPVDINDSKEIVPYGSVVKARVRL